MPDHKQTAQHFARALMHAESMDATIHIEGLPFVAGEVLRDQMDYTRPEHDHLFNVFAVLCRVARDGDEGARKLLTRIGMTYAYFKMDQEPEPEDFAQHPRRVMELDADTPRQSGHVLLFLFNSL